MGVTKEIVTGDVSYNGGKLTTEILNTRYLLVRDIFKNFVEKKLLLAMAIQNNWYDEEDGEKEYYYPKLTFNRLNIRDNQEMFESLFSLYQKGSLPIQVIYEIFNLDPDEMNSMLVDDLFTARDSTFNDLLRQANQDVGGKLVETTDLVDRVAKYCGLKKIDEDSGTIKITPVPDIGGNVFSAPSEEPSSSIESEAPEEKEEEPEGDLFSELESTFSEGEETESIEESPAPEEGGDEIVEE
jgi:hypothetical protein